MLVSHDGPDGCIDPATYKSDDFSRKAGMVFILELTSASSPSPLGIKNVHFKCLSLSGEGEPISSVTRNIFIADGIFVINDLMHFVKRRLLVRPPNRQHTIMYVKNKYSEACSSSSEVCNGIPRTACLAKNLKRLATMIMLFRLVC